MFDGGGLYLAVSPAGTKLWRLKYRFCGKERQIAFGPYPEVSLAQARELRARARQQIREGIDPVTRRRAERAGKSADLDNTFEVIGREWHEKRSSGWVESHSSKVLIRLEKNVFPWIGKLPITEINAPILLATLRRMEDRGALDTARRVRQYIAAIFRYAIQTGRAVHNIATDLVDATATPIAKNYASIKDPELLGRLLRDIDAYEGTSIVRTALALAPMLFCRPGELRGMRWSELDLDNAIWRIPPARQKLRLKAKVSNQSGDHVVPLPTQAVRLLRDLQPLTGKWDHVFPSERSRRRSMSDGAINAALRRMGYSKEQITGHGFRHTASTMLNEQQRWSSDAIEVQLSHKDPNLIRGIYNGAKYLDERKQMMQAWADYLCALRDTKESRR